MALLKTYSLDDPKESERLESQSKLSDYSIAEELQSFPRDLRGRVLDAGCGTGIASRELCNISRYSTIEGCDFSELRIEEARKTAKKEGLPIQYYVSSLEEIQAKDNSYQAVVIRYVFEHVANPQKILSEIHRVLKPGGMIYIINFDGIVTNLFSNDIKLQEQIRTIRTNAPFDLEVGRKLPSFVSQTGFNTVNWNMSLHTFQNKKLKDEKEMLRIRFEFAKPVIAQLLGSIDEAVDFSKRYLDAFEKPETTLFYNKFIVTGRK